MKDELLKHQDASARQAALDTSGSFLVQAPAGSGKTDLLTRRFLKLLAAVNEPEEILAITFTRAATAEMRSRILDDLQRARDGRDFTDPGRAIIAHAALQHSEQRGWRLLEQPERLDIQTIDSLCLRLAHEQPLLARLGGHLQPSEDTSALYEEAARRTLGHLGSSSEELNAALHWLLTLRDNSLGDTEHLLTRMLATRDQWLHAFPLSSEVDWEDIRLSLETNIRRAIRDVLQQAHRAFSSEPAHVDELMELARYACSNENKIDIALLSELRSLPESSEHLTQHWQCLCNLLLTDQNEWRKQLNKNHGFPKENKRQKERMEALLVRFARNPELLPLLCRVRTLPPASYSEEQWQTLRAIFVILRIAVAELRVLFAERNVIDFVEASLAAETVLREPGEATLAATARIHHLLVDEFQDTSLRQHQLIAAITADWADHDGHTCFLVGDPMQSIYLFRQAEVELFTRVQRQGRITVAHQWSCSSLTLSRNFRSHHALVEPLNGHFERIFASAADPVTSVPFSPSFAEEALHTGQAINIHATFARRGKGAHPDREDIAAARRQEAETVLAIIRTHLPSIEHAQATGAEFRIAVLGRAKNHLAAIAAKLRAEAIPFRSIELEKLGERQEIRDLLSLTRALLHPMDRIAWLATLRAPWCGLTLRDLHTLCGSDDPLHKHKSVIELIAAHAHLLTADGQLRLQRARTVLERALAVRYAQAEAPSFSTWIERTWHALGGHLLLDNAARENESVFFQMLDGVSLDGIACFTDQLDHELTRLFAQPDPAASERCGVQLMTIHKSKGLGFDVVIVPGLDRRPPPPKGGLVNALERPAPADPLERELLLAPIGSKGSETEPLYKWIRGLINRREEEERKRLFYVACTRARTELHLLGNAVITKEAGKETGVVPSYNTSLLASAWPALKEEFTRQYEHRTQNNLIAFPQQPLAALAAAADVPPLTLRRVPAEFAALPLHTAENVTLSATNPLAAEKSREFKRPEGSRSSRITGSIVHALLQAIADYGDSSPALLEQQAERMLRAASITGDDHRKAMQEIQAALRSVRSDATGMWLLGQRRDARSESSWTGYIDQQLRTVRADRIFRAGSEPLAEGQDCLWIVDYKTSTTHGDVETFLALQRKIYEPQLALYGQVLRAAQGEDIPLRLALYYPRLSRLDYWES
ncbi:MAG: UvrD-helicase domain-containing protein [Acidobacteria bacterium]|nr:UvrD-helicase domain-containing protein [Acidobacteriota bacterium]MBW4043365.1 UvrD-helicase domain-containing protein [Acidobacteriota bacterium]